MKMVFKFSIVLNTFVLFPTQERFGPMQTDLDGTWFGSLEIPKLTSLEKEEKKINVAFVIYCVYNSTRS